jgi:hypothetical protein
MSIRTCLVIALSLLVIHSADVRADIDEPSSSCVRNNRTFTCPDGTTIDVCDDCSGGTSGSYGGNGDAGKGMIKAIGMLIVVAVFVPGFVLSPAVAVELFFGKGKNIFGDKTKAREQFKAFREDQASTERAGKQVIEARLEIDKSEIMRDAIASTTLTTKRRIPVPGGLAWLTNMPRLVPSRDIACKQAGMLFKYHLNPNDPIAGFANVAVMLNDCAGRFETGVPAVDAAPDGTCPGATLRCMRILPSGLAACCPQGRSVLNAIDNRCYRDMDYRGATGDAAQRFLGGEHCPASASP